MGTAKALVNSGNIDLIRSSELRTAIIVYIESVEAIQIDIVRYEESYYRRGMNDIEKQVSLSSFRAMVFKERDISPTKNSSAYKQAVYALPLEFEHIPFPISLDDLFSNEIIYSSYGSLLTSHRNTAWEYEQDRVINHRLMDWNNHPKSHILQAFCISNIRPNSG